MLINQYVKFSPGQETVPAYPTFDPIKYLSYITFIHPIIVHILFQVILLDFYFYSIIGLRIFNKKMNSHNKKYLNKHTSEFLLIDFDRLENVIFSLFNIMVGNK